jgi:FkbM family methyltransferase
LYGKKGESRSIPLTIINLGSYEKEELAMQLQLIKNGDTVLDIGGNVGWYALYIAKDKPMSVVHSFEPLPPTFEEQQTNIKLNPDIKNVVPHNFGFSNKVGSFDFYIDPAISGNASLVNVADKKDIKVFKCKVETLDEFVSKDNVNVDFIKCDVEGNELFVFEGGIGTLEKYKPIVFTEMLRKWSAKFNYHPNRIIELFGKLNYKPYVIGNAGKLLPFGWVDENTIETNYFFLHQEKHIEIIKKFVSEKK